MRAEEVTVRILLAGILIFIIAITANILSDAGVRTYLIVLWCAIVLVLGLSAAGPLGMVPKEWGSRFLIIAVIAIAVTIVLQLRLVPICGDNVCAAGECNRCAADCKPADCANGACDLKVERCDTSGDCACAPEAACAPGRQGADPRGCAPIACGDGFCDSGEGPRTCCTDCGCEYGYKCERNICFFEVPKVTFTAYRFTDTISAASLAGNPLLTDAAGNARPLMRIELRTTKPVEDVRVTFRIPQVLEDTMDVGAIYAEQERDVEWTVQPDPRLMDITSDRETAVEVDIAYKDAFGNKYQLNRSFPMTILSRNTLDPYGHIVLFTTEVETKSSTPQGIWEELSGTVDVQHRTGTRIQFPAETLEKGTGAPRDIAVLLASAYNTAGLRTYLVESPDGYFVRVWDKSRFVMLDPALFDGSFDQAISFKPGYGVYDINKTFEARNFTQIDVS